MLEPDIAIGILAYNEESRIETTLRTLFLQDIFQTYPTEIIVVANGCTDDTVAVANRSIVEHTSTWSDRGSARVEEIVVAGKANAWNRFVHEFSSRSASILFLMDADISLLSADTLSSMVAKLKNGTQAVVCVDIPLKDIARTRDRTIFQNLLVAATPRMDPDDVPLCGQLYCALSIELRRIKLPLEIVGEDGFLRALLLTQGFTRAENRARIVLDDNVAHGFASVANLRELFKHEVWIVSASIVNMMLFERFARECNSNRSAMTLMKEWSEQNPKWLPQYIRSEVEKRGWRLLPRSWWSRRWSRLRMLPAWQRVKQFPVALIATLADSVIFLLAIHNVRRGRGFRYWGR